MRALSDLHVAAFSCILMWSFLCVHAWQRSLSPTVSVTLMRTLIPVDQGSAHMTSFMTSPLITFLKALAPNAVTRKVRASTHGFLRDTIQPIVRKWRCNQIVLTSICMEFATFTTK